MTRSRTVRWALNVCAAALVTVGIGCLWGGCEQVWGGFNYPVNRSQSDCEKAVCAENPMPVGGVCGLFQHKNGEEEVYFNWDKCTDPDCVEGKAIDRQAFFCQRLPDMASVDAHGDM